MFRNALLDETELLRKVASGNEHAFKVLYDHYRSSVHSRAFYLLRSDSLAEEVLQEVMLKLWQSAAKLDRETNIAAYLTTLTRNRSFNVLKRMAIEARADVELRKTWTEQDNATEEEILLADTKKILSAGIALLPPQQKMAYELCRLEGLTYEQAALRMNLGVETVKSYMKLALRFLRTYLKTHTDVAAILILFKLF